MSTATEAQIADYRAARRGGATLASACVLAGISMGDARRTEAEDLRNQPHSPAPEGAPQAEKDVTMASAARTPDEVEEVIKPDFGRAVRLFRQDIKPANEKSGEYAQSASTAYKAIKDECHVNTRAAKFAFKLAGESEEKRNDILRSLRGLLAEMNIGITDDLVSTAEDEAKDPVVPTAPTQRPKLVTVPTSDGVDADLNPDGDDD